MASERDGDDGRPDPDLLLRQVAGEEAAAAGGILKIFFGYAAGVGKTYAMLRAAHIQKSAGIDVVVGYLESHGRVETEALLSGLEALPPQTVSFRGISVAEFDLPEALDRHPELIIVDEFAHTNADGVRHVKRWQDIVELLDAGVNVYTTLNVQHIESLNDVVTAVTGIVVRETIPDEVFDRAAQIEIIDLPPEELLRRFEEGKVYLPGQAKQAMSRFFQRPNLIALREIALRRVADRLNIDVETNRLSRATLKVLPTTEHLLVCVGPSSSSADVIRQARRMALVFHAKWIALHAETRSSETMSAESRNRLNQNMRLAEELGAEVVTIRGESVAATTLDYARRRNVTKIVIGKNIDRRPLFDVFRPNIVNQLLENGGSIAVYVIPGEHRQTAPRARSVRPQRVDRRGALVGLAILAASNLVSLGFSLVGLSLVNIAMVFVLGAFFVTVLSGRLIGVAASVLGVLSFDFFFVPPTFTFAVSDSQYLITFAILLVVCLVTNTFLSQSRLDARNAAKGERRAESLYRLSRNLSRTTGLQQIATIAEEELKELFSGEVAIFLHDENHELFAPAQDSSALLHDQSERAVALWVLSNNRMAGLGTDTLPGSRALYLPLSGSAGAIGVIGLQPKDPEEARDPVQRSLFEAFGAQIAVALERERLAEQTQRVFVQAESERLRNSLLRSISHDLRSPLAGVSGAASTLLEKGELVDPETRQRLLRNIYEDSSWLTQLVENLLNMTRLETERLTLARQWEAVDDLIASVLTHMKGPLADRKVTVTIPPRLTMVPMEGGLIEQVMLNILDNALKYTPAGSPIDIAVETEPDLAIFSFADRGPGIDQEDLDNLFVKFFRGRHQRDNSRQGAGLGLSISKAIVEAHGGEIHAANRSGGGAVFTFSLPIAGDNPLESFPDERRDAGPAE